MDLAHFMRWRGALVVEIHEYLDVPAPYMLENIVSLARDPVAPRSPGIARDEIVARAQSLAGFKSHAGSNLDGLREYFSPDVVCEFVGNRARIPYAGRHVGLDALIAVLRSINTDFEQFKHVLSDIVVEDGRFAARRSLEWRHRGTGRRGCVELAEFLRFENGSIVEFIEFRDNVKVLEMQGAWKERSFNFEHP